MCHSCVPDVPLRKEDYSISGPHYDCVSKVCLVKYSLHHFQLNNSYKWDTHTHIYSTYICTLTFPTFHGLRFHFRFKLLCLFSIGLKLLNNKCATCRWTLWWENELLQTWNGYKSIATLHIYSLSFITHLWFTVYSLRWSGVPSRVYSCFMPSVPGRDSRSTNGPDQDKMVTEEVLFSILLD